MGIFGKKSFKVAFLTGDGLFGYGIEKNMWNDSGLEVLLAQIGKGESFENHLYEFNAYLINERETAGRHYVNVVGPTGKIALIDDYGLWIVIVQSVQKMKLAGVQTPCRLIIDRTAGSSTQVHSMRLDLPSGFSADLKTSPGFQIIEVQEE
jgi:hypothetical protein